MSGTPVARSLAAASRVELPAAVKPRPYCRSGQRVWSICPTRVVRDGACAGRERTLGLTGEWVRVPPEPPGRDSPRVGPRRRPYGASSRRTRRPPSLRSLEPTMYRTITRALALAFFAALLAVPLAAGTASAEQCDPLSELCGGDPGGPTPTTAKRTLTVSRPAGATVTGSGI